MTVRWMSALSAALLLAATLALSACESRPGDHAYGRYSQPNQASKSSIQPYSDDWYKDVGTE